jgi:hypothetical protein
LEGRQAVYGHTAINYPVMIGNDRLAELYGGVDSLPSTFLIDRKGRIAFLGLVAKRDLRNRNSTVDRSVSRGPESTPQCCILLRNSPFFIMKRVRLGEPIS